MNGQGIEVKSVDLCKRVEDKVIKEADDDMGRGGQAERGSKVTLDSITSYNQKLVTHQESKKSELCKLLRHERLYKMMKVGSLSKDNSLWFYLDHFAANRAGQIETLSASVEENNRLQGPKSEKHDAKYLSDYFKGYK